MGSYVMIDRALGLCYVLSICMWVQLCKVTMRQCILVLILHIGVLDICKIHVMVVLVDKPAGYQRRPIPLVGAVHPLHVVGAILLPRTGEILIVGLSGLPVLLYIGWASIPRLEMSPLLLFVLTTLHGF